MKRSAWLATLLILLATLAVFWPSLRFGYVFDDRVYVTDNDYLGRGLSPEALRWSFTTTYAAYWHPLTWISFLADVSLFGPGPFGHHLTNVLLHAANGIGLFLLLAALTGAPWRSAFVALAFAVHPLHVESVAWVSGRKDVLSSLFAFATLLLYVRFLRRRSLPRYAAVLAAYVAGLMAKPMLVTLPFAMLLLDHWPAARFSGTGAAGRVARAVAEKIPMMLLIPPFIVANYVAEVQYGGVDASRQYPFLFRLGNALLSYGAYLVKTVWPVRLSAFYPHPGYDISWTAVAASAVFLAAATAVVLRQVRRRPWLFTGWFWYLGTLVPVIGLIQIGRMGMADRFTYLPLIGIFVVAAWGVPELCAALRAPRWAPAAAGAAVLVAWACLAWVQVGHWRDDVALFGHAARIEPGSFLVRFNLAEALQRAGDLGGAEEQYRLALDINPRETTAITNLAAVLSARGDQRGAIALLRRALELEPDLAEARYSLATLLLGTAELDEALAQMERVIGRQPSSEAFNNLGVIHLRRGDAGRAAAAFREALRLDPANRAARENLAMLGPAAGGAP